MANMVGLLGFFAAMTATIATVVGPFILPALIVQAIRVRSRGFVLAAVLGASAYGGWVGYILLSLAKNDPISAHLLIAITVLLMVLGFIAALIAAWHHPRKPSAP